MHVGLSAGGQLRAEGRCAAKGEAGARRQVCLLLHDANHLNLSFIVLPKLPRHLIILRTSTLSRRPYRESVCTARGRCWALTCPSRYCRVFSSLLTASPCVWQGRKGGVGCRHQSIAATRCRRADIHTYILLPTLSIITDIQSQCCRRGQFHTMDVSVYLFYPSFEIISNLSASTHLRIHICSYVNIMSVDLSAHLCACRQHRLQRVGALYRRPHRVLHPNRALRHSN
jgi:hypothetical protein